MASPFALLVAMQIMRLCLASPGVPSGLHAPAAPRKSLFLDQADPNDELLKINEQALDIRKKSDALSLEFKMMQVKDKAAIDDLHSELRAVSGQLAGNVALENSAKNSAERELVQSTKLKADLVRSSAMCETQLKHLNASVAIHGDQSKVEALRSLSSHCDVAAFAAIHSSLLQGCSEEVATPMLAAGVALEKEARDLATPFAKQAFSEALRHATVASIAHPAFLASDKAWPSQSKPKSNGKAKSAAGCKMTEGAVNCGLLHGQLAALAKRLQEQKDTAMSHQRKQGEECVLKEKAIHERMRATDAQHARSSAELVRVIGIKAGLAASKASIQQRLERTERDAKQFEESCQSSIKQYKGELEDILKKRQVIANKVAGHRVAIHDCAVTEWRFSKCSKECKAHNNETAGYMEATRQTHGAAGLEGMACPQLSVKLTCNDKPCPIDCAVAEWVKWSTCSKACGGGTTSRKRKVTTQPKDGGKSCPMVESRKLCNTGRCGDVCKLAEWTPWSGCSRRCKFSTSSAAGRQQRKREVIGNPMRSDGSSSCPVADDTTRLQNRACNEEICPKDMKCDASQDVLFLLDGSGAGGSDFKKQLSLASSIVKASSQKLRFGVVAFGKETKILSRITADRAQLASISSYMPLVGGMRDSAKGESVGGTLFSDPGGGRRPKVAVLLLGGAPDGFVESKKAAEGLRAAGVRIVVGLVDDGSELARQQACSLASAPCAANVEAVKSFEQMAAEPTRFLAAICREAADPSNPEANTKKKTQTPKKGDSGPDNMPAWMKKHLGAVKHLSAE